MQQSCSQKVLKILLSTGDLFCYRLKCLYGVNGYPKADFSQKKFFGKAKLNCIFSLRQVSYGIPIGPVRAVCILYENFQYGTSEDPLKKDSHQNESVIESMNLGKGTNILFSWFQQEEDTEGNKCVCKIGS